MVLSFLTSITWIAAPKVQAGSLAYQETGLLKPVQSVDEAVAVCS